MKLVRRHGLDVGRHSSHDVVIHIECTHASFIAVLAALELAVDRRLRLFTIEGVSAVSVLCSSVLVAMAASGEVTLRAFLEKNGVHKDIVAFLDRSHCNSVLQFSEWVDEKKDLKAAVMDQVASVKNDRGAYVALKVAWC